MLSMARVDIVWGCVKFSSSWSVSRHLNAAILKMLGLTDSSRLWEPSLWCGAWLQYLPGGVCCGRKLDEYDCSVHTSRTFESPLPADTPSAQCGIVTFSSSPSSTTTIIPTSDINFRPRATSVDHSSSLSLSVAAAAGIGTSAVIVHIVILQSLWWCATSDGLQPSSRHNRATFSGGIVSAHRS